MLSRDVGTYLASGNAALRLKYGTKDVQQQLRASNAGFTAGGRTTRAVVRVQVRSGDGNILAPYKEAIAPPPYPPPPNERTVQRFEGAFFSTAPHAVANRRNRESGNSSPKGAEGIALYRM